MRGRSSWGRAFCLAGLLPGLLPGLLAGCGSDEEVAGYEQLSGSGGAGGATSSSAAAPTTAQAQGSGGGGSDKLGPPYPIVLSHGFFGFNDFAGAGFLTYFYNVKDHLAEHGEPLVFTPAVDPFNDSTARGAELADEIAAILEQTGYAKVNIIGHSQGGLDARVVAHEHPDMVASVVTLETPNHGTPIADIALGLVDDPALADILDALVQTVGKALYDQVGEESDLGLAIHEFSEPGITAFNAKYTDMPGVYYASIAGRSDLHSGGSACNVAGSPPFIAAWHETRDPIDPLLSLTEALLDGGFGDPYPNDGLVRVPDARWGNFLGCIPADHLDAVGQIFADGPGFGNDWDYLAFYVDLIRYLRAKGL